MSESATQKAYTMFILISLLLITLITLGNLVVLKNKKLAVALLVILLLIWVISITFTLVMSGRGE